MFIRRPWRPSSAAAQKVLGNYSEHLWLDFRWFGKTLGGLDVPVASAMEGGYSDDLPDLVFAYLEGLLGK